MSGGTPPGSSTRLLGLSTWTVVALLVAASAAAAVSIRSFDFGWHLRSGEDILLAGGRPPSVDTLSYTAGGHAWVDHEWLFQIGLAALVRQGGLAAVWALKLFVAWLVVLVTAPWLLARHRAPWAVTLVILVALEGARFRFSVRPELAGLALLPVLLWLLDRAHRGAPGRALARLAAVPLVIVLWVNLHPSALLAVAIIGVFAAVVMVQHRGRGERPLAFGLTAVLSGVCLLANPYGAGILGVPLAIRSALAVEGLANPEWGNALQRPFWMFWLLLPLCAVLLWRSARRGERQDWPLLAVGVVLALGAALALRLLGFFYVALPWVVATVLPRSSGRGALPVGGHVDARGAVGAGGGVGTDAFDPDQGLDAVRPPRTVHGGRAAGLSGLGILGVAAPVVLPLGVAVIFLLVPRPGDSGLGPGLSPGRFPEAMARAHLEHGVQGHLYNPVRFGGYLSWALPGVPVFLDGRNELHGPLLALMADCRRRADVGCWEDLLDRWDVQAAIVEYDSRRLAERRPDGSIVTHSAASVWFRRGRWALIDWDDTAMLYVRRDGVNAALATRLEDHWLTPDDADGFARRLAAGSIDLQVAHRELAGRLAARPRSARARLLASLLAADRSDAVHRKPKQGDLGDAKRPSE